ncbi:response regulator [Pseudorhodobacter turbinis]|uniref:response regulator n=1 Tax=Pseudorhodobacter turbinis TaxID=2500533 RepID=UPI001F0F72FF|nr:response regulator [Pseudorhodobacter turbinis]
MTLTPIVLLVEDEAIIRISTADVLRDQGWEVREAANAADALKMLEQDEDIELIFTDIDMPGATNGLGLAHVVSERWPTVQIVITSGMSQPSANELPLSATFVPKPYMVEELVIDFRTRLIA